MTNLGPTLAMLCNAIDLTGLPIRSIRAGTDRHISVQADNVNDLDQLADRFGLTDTHHYGSPDFRHTAATGTWADIDLRIWAANPTDPA